MQIVRRREELAQARAGLSGSVALVPTMGALHAGHLALVAEAQRRADHVIATIFVNPTQFNDAGDLANYPRTEESDLDHLRVAGCDLVWLPGIEDIYPGGFATTVSVGAIATRWEGEHRPGHFDGVATVVAKLFIATRPDMAIFGEKDWQQLAVIRRMNTDLGLDVEIVGHHTVRENDGLAMSSRNGRLSHEERKLALALPIALDEAREAIKAGEPVRQALAEAKMHLLANGFLKVDYVALVDGDNLEPVDTGTPGSRLIAAATIGKTRLIDNLGL